MKSRTFAWALLAGLIAASPSWAQLALPTYGLGTPYGRGVYHGGRHMTVGGYIRGGYPLPWNPYGYVGGFSSATIIITPPAITFRSAAPSVELPSFPQIPPLNERDILAIKPVPGGVKNLPPIRKAAAAPPAKMVAPPPALLAPPPAADKKVEAQRQIKLGKESFAEGEPGAALEHFQQATSLDPEIAEGFFLLAQSRFALGRFREATATIVKGLKLKPDWPKSNFNPRELYGQRGVDFMDDLDRLRVAVEQNPDEPALQFLYGYELWFVGRKKEAREWFERAAKQVADPAPIRRFLDTP